MARFQFKFQALLRHREAIEEQRQRELARHLRTQMIFRDRLRQMQQTISDSKRQLGASLTGRVDLAAVADFARYSGQNTVLAQQIVVRLAELEREIDIARAALLEATRQRKALELLRDRQFEAWRQEQQRREAVVLDELATQQYTRQLVTEQSW